MFFTTKLVQSFDPYFFSHLKKNLFFDRLLLAASHLNLFLYFFILIYLQSYNKRIQYS